MIGLLAFRAGGAEQFREAIDRAIRTPEGTTIWYLRVIHHIAQQADVWTLDIAGEEWGEVDFPADVESGARADGALGCGDQSRGSLTADDAELAGAVHHAHQVEHSVEIALLARRHGHVPQLAEERL